MRIFFFVLAMLAFCGAGCATRQVYETPRRVSLARGVAVDTAPLAAALLGSVQTLKLQTLEVSWRDRAFTAEVVIKPAPGRLSIVLLSPTMRLATITLEAPHRLTYEPAARVPDAFLPEYALVDLAAVHVPPDALRAALGPSFAVKERGDVREILHGAQVIRRVRRLPEGGVLLDHPAAGYTCRIQDREG